MRGILYNLHYLSLHHIIRLMIRALSQAVTIKLALIVLVGFFSGFVGAVTYSNPIYSIATGSFNQKVATVLDAMSGNITNSSQQTLINAFAASTTQQQLNDNLHQMMPVANTVIFNAQMQSTIYNKVESRIASLHHDWQLPGLHTGLNAGEVSPYSSVWISSTGSLTAQGPVGEDDGYNAKSAVFLIGGDKVICDDSLGIAGGYSLSHIKEYSNPGFINNVYRYHGLIYGSHNFEHNNYLDWLFTGSFNNNTARRSINVTGNNFSTTADYKGYQLSGKIIRGKGYDFWDSYRFTPSTYLQYTFLHQNSYTEAGSVAALNVDEINKNIATLGLGARFNFPLDAWKIVGMRELRANFSYDVINSKNFTTASFLVGSSSFSVASSPKRWGVQLGAGILFVMSKHLQLALDYDFEIRSHFTDHTGLVKIKVVF